MREDDLACCREHRRFGILPVTQTSLLGFGLLPCAQTTWLGVVIASILACCNARRRLGLLPCAQTTRVGVVSASVMVRRRKREQYGLMARPGDHELLQLKTKARGFGV